MKIILFFTFLSSLIAFSQEKDDSKNSDQEKIFTQKQFDEEVEKQLNKYIERVKKKSLTELTKEVFEKESEMKKREAMLRSREEQIRIGEESLAKQIVEFEKEKQKILGCINDNKQKEAMRINQLVKMVSGMKPAKAAEILSVQESAISVRILEKIDPARASKIFNMMDKEISARLQKQYLNMKQ